MTTGELHLTDKELTKRWRLARGTLANWRLAGKGPAYIRFGRKILYRLSDVEAYETAHACSTAVGITDSTT